MYTLNFVSPGHLHTVWRLCRDHGTWPWGTRSCFRLWKTCPFGFRNWISIVDFFSVFVPARVRPGTNPTLYKHVMWSYENWEKVENWNRILKLEGTRFLQSVEIHITVYLIGSPLEQGCSLIFSVRNKTHKIKVGKPVTPEGSVAISCTFLLMWNKT